MKTAIVSQLAKLDVATAQEKLKAVNGRVRLAIGSGTPMTTATAGAKRPEENFLVVTEDDCRLAILEQAHDLVREAVLVNAVAEADQFVDLAHQPERMLEAGGVAVKVGDDAELHCGRPARTRSGCT